MHPLCKFYAEVPRSRENIQKYLAKNIDYQYVTQLNEQHLFRWYKMVQQTKKIFERPNFYFVQY